ncbi:threonine/serine exporter family protein [Aeromonas rivipollensis]|uniref:threonine/serine exporter family protein n=1 Tax=Aeromonas rivipollensis TaxID=948519 RepID=UPI00259E062E|nr:threonine/serine exporter family protein [Aeromonas rivipollensis]MDM5092242.1 threonine/serine exporter family protein [Aeromonas rivipollensis]
MRSITPRRVLSREQQTEITRIIVKVGQLLAQHGAEGRIIEQTTVRLGLALGLESVEMAISASAIVLTSLYQGSCVTTTRRVRDQGINMQVVCEVQRICIMAEKELIGVREVRQRLDGIVPFHYHPWLVVPMVGLSCGAFSLLFGGDWPIFLVTFIAAAVAMRVRQLMARHHHSPLINFAATGFVATLIASCATYFQWGDQPYLAMAASVLLLVPGFPLINAVSDMVKGYFNLGLARWGMATLLTISAVIGIVLAMSVTGIWGWKLWWNSI